MARFESRWNTIGGDAQFGKVQLYVDTDEVAANTAVRFKLVNPLGVTVRDYPVSADYTVPGIPPGGLSAPTNLAIPFTGNDFVRGTYTVIAKGTLSAVDTLYSTTFFFSPSNNKLDATQRDTNGDLWAVLTPSVDCGSAEVTFTDDTDETGWTVDDEDIVVQPPLIPGVTPPSPVTGADAVTETFTYTNVTYTATLAIERSKATTGPGDWIHNQAETIYATASQLIDCGNGICALLPCLDSMFNVANNAACTLGGWARVPAKQMADLQAAQTMLSMYTMNANCGNLNRAAELRTLFLEQFGGNCDCGCSDSGLATSNPIPYTP